MKKLIFFVSAVLMLAFWPLSFLFANQDSWVPFFVALTILLVDWLLYLNKFKYHYFLYLLFPLIHPALLLFPIISLIFIVISTEGKPRWRNLTLAIFTSLLIIVSFFSYKTFYAYSIFTPDPLAFDTLNKKISLIPNRNLAKVFMNKTTIFQDKFKSNIFISLDPNNYFFGLHPQELGNNQNLTKFPYLAIFPFLIGLYYLLDSKSKHWIISIFVAIASSIAFINNQDRFDILLYLPIVLICLNGLKKIFDSSSFNFSIFSAFFIPISIIELARLIIFR